MTRIEKLTLVLLTVALLLSLLAMTASVYVKWMK
jgi:hypothetical protein